MTLDERLTRAAQKVQDSFEALEAPPLPEPAARPAARPQSRAVAAAAAFLAVVVFGATLLWLGPFTGEDSTTQIAVRTPSLSQRLQAVGCGG